ncbi:PilZ domain-containing protein [Pelagerythrobacter sp.]|uniref:PilZ domain-containing protein n=1 Tax=Pelagerythrobacter sp. TaxID=2800702 RepID=UPI0035B0DF91
MQQDRSDAQASDPRPAEDRAAPRFTLLIRAAKFVAPQGQFVCVIRDVSATGVSLRGFHRLPGGDALTVELQSGERHAVEKVWERDLDSGYRFLEPVEVAGLIAEGGDYPRRQVRIDIDKTVYVEAGGQTVEACITNISQQGAGIECPYLLAIGQPLRLVADDLPDISARVRWREGRRFGLAFDTTFDLRTFALMVARLQCPQLLAGQPQGY